MKIVIVGGSNSQKADGYQKTLRSFFKNCQFINLSIGAAPSAMGVYRLLSNKNLQSGDLLIWEYALNDLNHILYKKYSAEFLLKQVEYTLKIAIRRKLKLLPLIFIPRILEFSNRISTYRNGLHFLFSHYGIDFIDVSHHIRKSKIIRRLPKEFYSDENHYAMTTEFTNLIVESVESALLEKIRTTPFGAAPLFIEPYYFPAVYDRPRAGTSYPFHNKLIQLETWSVTNEPVVFDSFRSNGYLVGLIVIASRAGGAVRLRSGTTDLTFSLCHDEPRFNRPLVKIITIPNLISKPIEINSSTEIRFDASVINDHTLCDFGFRLPTRSNTPGEYDEISGRLVALLTEENKQGSNIDLRAQSRPAPAARSAAR